MGNLDRRHRAGVSVLGMATGPIAGGRIYATFAQLAWLYIGCVGALV